MPQQRCLDKENTFYHVYNRGVNKQIIFLDDMDRYYFLKLCRKAKQKFNLYIHAFCLMSNHYHLLIFTVEVNLSKAMKYIGETYSKYFVQKYKDLKKSGHTFMGRYGRKIIHNNQYMETLFQYIHFNPVKDKFCDSPDLYKWSSYNSYKSQKDIFNITELSILNNYFKHHSNIDPRHITNPIQLESNTLKLKPFINSSLMKKHLDSYKVNDDIHRELSIYCLLEWTELDSYDLEEELGIPNATIRGVKRNIKFALEENNLLLENLIFSVKKYFGLF